MLRYLTMKTIGHRIREEREKSGLTQPQLAEACGWESQGRISNYENGLREPKLEDLKHISNALKIPTSKLLVDYLKEDSAIYNVSTVNNEILEKRLDVPLLTWVSAGAWLNNQGSFTEADAERWLPCPVAHSKMTFALKVEGDSMTSPYPNDKSYPHGTLIYVDPERTVVNGCRVVALLKNQQAYTFKRYVEDAGRKYLKPLNPTYESILITDDIEIVGVVIGAFID